MCSYTHTNIHITRFSNDKETFFGCNCKHDIRLNTPIGTSEAHSEAPSTVESGCDDECYIGIAHECHETDEYTATS